MGGLHRVLSIQESTRVLRQQESITLCINFSYSSIIVSCCTLLPHHHPRQPSPHPSYLHLINSNFPRSSLILFSHPFPCFHYKIPFYYSFCSSLSSVPASANLIVYFVAIMSITCHYSSICVNY